MTFGVLFENGMFAPHNLRDGRSAEVLHAATDRAVDTVQPSDILHAAIAGGDLNVQIGLSRALEPGVRPEDLRRIIDIYRPGRLEAIDFDGRRELFSRQALVALDAFAEELASPEPPPDTAVLEVLLVHTLENLTPEDERELTPLDSGRAAEVFRQLADAASVGQVAIIDEISGRLRSEEFTESAWELFAKAGELGAELGYRLVQPPHLLLALLSETEGVAERLIRLQLPPEFGMARLRTVITEAFRLGDTPEPPLDPHRDALGESMPALLLRALRGARVRGAARIDAPDLLAALLEDMPPLLATVLAGPPLHLAPDRIRDHLRAELRRLAGRPARDVAFRLSRGLPPHEDLSFLARSGRAAPARFREEYFATIGRALQRRSDNNVLLVAEPGIGSTTLLRELARRAGAGELSLLARKRFVRLDCAEILPAESERVLEALIEQVGVRTDIVLCLDGLGPLLRAPHGARHNVLLRRAIKERRLHVVAVVAKHDFEDLLASDHALRGFFTRVEVEEPQDELRDHVVAAVAEMVSAEFQIRIDESVVARLVALAGSYVLNDHFPRKAVRILRRICEDVSHAHDGADPVELTTEHIVTAVAEATGLDPGQLGANGREPQDPATVLGERVRGQAQAVDAVARHLSRIAAGITEPGRPAAVLFFAGLTGVGKTELAKAIAEIYSVSGRLQTYPMANFTEGHYVSGITGVPPGYVGQEQGGRLINDLNADPQCVFLLDEADKAHPDIWKPFLNLFDEAWTVDMRGVKAYGDRAVFILTSNAGSETISRMAAAGASPEEIDEAVRGLLPSLRHRDGQVIFPPEFLARINQIITFRPLDLHTMTDICRLAVAERQTFWRTKRQRRLDVGENLIEYVANLAHLRNQAANGREGGRIVKKLLTKYIDDCIVRTAIEQPGEFAACAAIELAFSPSDLDVQVRLHREPS